MRRKYYLKWNGVEKNHHVIKKEVEETSFFKLYYGLVDKDIINTLDSDPYDLEVLEKNGKTWGDFYKDGELEYQLFTDWLYNEEKHLTDKEIWYLIMEKCNHYDYTIEVDENGDNNYREVTDKDFDRSGKFVLS